MLKGVWFEDVIAYVNSLPYGKFTFKSYLDRLSVDGSKKRGLGKRIMSFVKKGLVLGTGYIV